ncbi:hypothetical protein ACH0BF_21580 [Pseudobacillus sp. 179-B 2D1 NHS]|uniref:DinB/UmuC family translesion DNA polymerase n=1 Tax=Pseudobacillus sp. 179-B 2D1 NHS TaxID=3374292 RepID=UPI00387A5DC5
MYKLERLLKYTFIQKLFSKSKILMRDYYNEREIIIVIHEMVHEVAMRLRLHHRAAGKIALAISYSQDIKERGFKHQTQAMEKGREIKYSVSEKGTVVWLIGKPNISRPVRIVTEMEMGSRFKPTESELKHDDRLEEFKKYPKGTIVKANGEIAEG